MLLNLKQTIPPMIWIFTEGEGDGIESRLGAIFLLRKDIGVGGPENGNFPLLYVVKMSLRRWVGGSKKPQNTLTQYKD